MYLMTIQAHVVLMHDKQVCPFLEFPHYAANDTLEIGIYKNIRYVGTGFFYHADGFYLKVQARTSL